MKSKFNKQIIQSVIFIACASQFWKHCSLAAFGRPGGMREAGGGGKDRGGPRWPKTPEAPRLVFLGGREAVEGGFGELRGQSVEGDWIRNETSRKDKGTVFALLGSEVHAKSKEKTNKMIPQLKQKGADWIQKDTKREPKERHWDIGMTFPIIL